MRDDLVARLTKQLAARFRGRDPGDPKTRSGLDGTVARIRQAADAIERMPVPFPVAPRTAAISAEEAEAVIAAVLARLGERRWRARGALRCR